MKTLFEFEDYKEYLKAKRSQMGQEQRGVQTRWAEAAGCQPSFLSEVINGSVHFTPDHAANLCRHWGFSEEETDYFLELVTLARSVSPALRSRCLRRIAELRRGREKVRPNTPSSGLVGEERIFYYASWLPSAIHVALSIEGFQSVPALASRLEIAPERVEETLQLLKRLGVAKDEEHGRWSRTVTSLHLERGSPLSRVHHAAWRQRAAGRFLEGREENIHYTAVQGLSRADAETIKSLVLELATRSREIAAKSVDEDVYLLALDFDRV